jgi:hypothetical protein
VSAAAPTTRLAAGGRPDPADRWARRLVCSRTGGTAPLDEPAFLSPAGAPWLVEYDLDAEKGEALRRALPGRPWTLWRYRELLPLAGFESRADLGEGGTPLVRLGRTALPEVELWVKDESGNPTGSFKARGLSLAVNRARELGAPGVELPSAGNAALALAAYAAAAGLPARVALPSDTPATIAERCRLHGAEVLEGGRTLVEAARLLTERPPTGSRGAYWNLSTLKEPYRAEGKKTMGLELAEQLGWELPDWIVYPTGGVRRAGAARADRPRPPPAFRRRPDGRLRSDRARLRVPRRARRAVARPRHPGLRLAGTQSDRRLPDPPRALRDRRRGGGDRGSSAARDRRLRRQRGGPPRRPRGRRRARRGR